MVAGVERYFQIVRCFRDEDRGPTRACRRILKLILKCPFVTQNEVMELIEDMTITKNKIFGDKIVLKVPFAKNPPSRSYYKIHADKFDLRTGSKKDPHSSFCLGNSIFRSYRTIKERHFFRLEKHLPTILFYSTTS